MSVLKENRPTADILMNSMRAMGYSFESAVADIVDNSVSANANFIQILFPVSPLEEMSVAICDNGYGMDQQELFDAMKYGSEQKRDSRSDNDLGRFGLGLKAASLSQCRKLTAISKKEGKLSGYIWDLDIIQKERDWLIVECSDEQIAAVKHTRLLDGYESGTLVIWEQFDLIEKSSGSVYASLSRFSEEVTNYLELIFHRYLNRTDSKHIEIRVNNYRLRGLDPFLENHKKTNIRKRVVIPIADAEGIERDIVVQPFVLPFQRDLTDEDKKLSGGIEKYRSQQGFYVYRNERLIVWGSWFGRHLDELTKYARIRVDIPNTLDDIWGIDIKKQSAKIPTTIKNRLTRAVDDAMDIAVKAQTYRGRIEKVESQIDYIWNRIKLRGNHFVYKINRSSRIFELIRNKVDDETWNCIDMVLEEIENSLPYQQIYIDKSQNIVDDFVCNDERIAELYAKAKILINLALQIENNDRQLVIDKIMLAEPFNRYPQLKEKLLEE